MTDSEIFLKFVEIGTFSNYSINRLKETLSINDKRLLRNTFKLLNSEISYLEKSTNYIYIINNCIRLLNVICNNIEFDSEEKSINRNRIKKSREALLSYANKYNNEKILNAANKLDEIIIDKGIELEDLIVLIKRLIERKEDINIIKKLLNTNKGVLTMEDNILFDYTFNKSLLAIQNNTPDIYYYISLLKIFYSSTIDKTKYLNELNNICSEDNEFSNEIYYILHGQKRKLTEEEILDKYGIITNLNSINIITPEKYLDNNYVLTVDSDGANVRDDGLSIKKDGNNYIIGIHITDPASFIKPNSDIDYQSKNNFSCTYLKETSIRMLSNNIENSLSLNKDNNRKVISMYVVINNEGKILDYTIKENIVRISENLNYSECDLILDNSSDDISTVIHNLYDVACILKQKNTFKYDYWNKKENNNNNEVKHNSDIIVNELMVLYNYLIAKEACESYIPYVYRTQSNSYLDNLAKKLNISITDDALKVLETIYLKSKYSEYPIYHSGLHLNLYSHSSSPLIKYPDLYNQYLLHKFYFKDLDFDFNEEKHKELIEYFNQRSTELSLMASEYSRALKLKKD